MIINNAGFGGGSRFESSSPEFLDRMIQLNIRAVTFLIRLMIPELKRHDKAWIMNISSMAAFIPMPFKTIYPASKAFVYSFSRALSEELKNTGISVSVVNPGPIMTNVDVIRRFKSYGILSRMCLISAEQVASQSIRSMLSGKKVIIPGMLNKINRFLIKLIPDSLSLYLVSNLSRRELTSPGKINLRK
jgi:short-subunit dehydrogenase